MYLTKLLPLLTSISLFLLPLASCNPLSPRASWPYAPLTTSGRWILDSAGHNITYAGVNWPGAADTMIPEGLQYASIASIVTKIKSLGMNVIRLTYAIEMVDDYYANGQKDVTVKDSLVKALGQTNGTSVFAQIMKQNPGLGSGVTRMQVFDAVAAECFKQQIYVHLDNHVSKAIWCCGTTDGNSWFGDTYFNVANWTRGLAYMAKRGAAWGNLVSMSLRNELREPTSNPSLDSSSYNWATWYTNIVSGMNAIHNANSIPLIFISGLNYDTDLSPIPNAAVLTPSTSQKFVKSSFSYANKLVLELHNYATDSSSCSSLQSSLVSAGYSALGRNGAVTNQMPVVLTEWGHAQTGSDWGSVYSTCLKSYLGSVKGGWMVWVLAGSYYIRSGTQDYDESWGLLNHNWSAWRDQTDVTNSLIPMVSGTKTWSP
ncbi:cellulase family protein [Rutstroemia sp. NJR-2017a WRK4]|nr:cellulase family protein [Rutstroemia sp. NJR-2017a WRK4]